MVIRPINLRVARQRAGFTQQEAADMLGYSLDGYAKKERGNRKMSSDFIKKAAEAFGCDPADILREVSESEVRASEPMPPIDLERLASFVVEARDRLAALSSVEARNLFLALISASRTR